MKNTKNAIKYFLLLLLLFTTISLFSCSTVDVYTVTFEATEGGYVRGGVIQKVNSGESTSVVKAINIDGYKFIGWNDGVKDEKRIIENVNGDLTLIALFEQINYTYPSMYITTKNNQRILSKEEYVKCNISVNDSFNTGFSFDDFSGKIRCRGNSTYDMPKKPYKLKFSDAVDLFGMGKAKTWVLLADYGDPSRIRNTLAFSIASKLSNLHYTSKIQHVELYVNGVYNGLYLVAEQIEVKENRVEIDDTIDDDLSFLIELDFRAPSEGTYDIDYFVVDDIPYGIKAPDIEENYPSSYTIKIKEFIKYCFEVIQKDNYQDICDIIDVESFVDSYILNELFGNVDVKFSSWYLYKDKHGKLFSGPVWDYDISAGNCNYDNLVIKTNFLYALYYNKWYYYLMEHREFKEKVIMRMAELKDVMLEEIDIEIEDALIHKSYFLRDDNLWHTLGQSYWPVPDYLVNITDWESQLDYVKNWLSNKLDYMMRNIK